MDSVTTVLVFLLIFVMPVVTVIVLIGTIVIAIRRSRKKKALKRFIATMPLGYTVTERVKQIDQPYGGFIKAKDMTSISLGEGIEALMLGEQVTPGLIGMAVDYLTRFIQGAPAEEAFKISLLGASIIGEKRQAKKLLSQITGLDTKSIVAAIKLTGYDVCYRLSPKSYKPVEGIIPDIASISNVATMVTRSIHFFKQYGPVVMDGFTFEGGYTHIIASGDGDFLTADTLWDFKVSKQTINKNQTLQLLIYWRMGVHSIHPEFQNVQYLGIFNPRQNIVSRIAVKDIPEETIRLVDEQVIGYVA